MAGLIFLRTTMLKEISNFYIDKIGMKLWLDQGGCNILQHGNMLMGFCGGNVSQTEGIITFFYQNREEVDAIYQKLQKKAENPPRYNPDYNIYHFYSRDPEERIIEFQYFENRVDEHLIGSENLMQRRSIRAFTEEMPSKDLLAEMFEICRYSPTSMNRQKYYYVVTDNRSKIKQLAKVRDSSTSPLANAPLVIAVCCNHETRRVQQDADIAATYLLLAAHTKGLGTCWITDMDRAEVKEALGIPLEDYITCLTPLGFPAEFKDLPKRRQTNEFVKWV